MPPLQLPDQICRGSPFCGMHGSCLEGCGKTPAFHSNKQRKFSHETSARAQEAMKSETSNHNCNINLQYRRLSIIKLEEYRGTLEESRNPLIRFKQSQETLGRCTYMAEMIDEICKLNKPVSEDKLI